MKKSITIIEMITIFIIGMVGVLFFIFLLSDSKKAKIVSSNISQEADEFRVYRRIIFYNGITDKYIFEIKGFCSIKVDRLDKQLEVIPMLIYS